VSTNPFRYRVYVIQTKPDGSELLEFVSGHRLQSEAQRSRENHERSMSYRPGEPDYRGVTFSVVVRDEPLPEFP